MPRNEKAHKKTNQMKNKKSSEQNKTLKEAIHSEAITKVSDVDETTKELLQCMNSMTIAAAPLMLMPHSSIEVVNNNLSVHVCPCNCNGPDKKTLMEMMNGAAGNPCNACNAKSKKRSSDSVFVACFQNTVSICIFLSENV